MPNIAMLLFLHQDADLRNQEHVGCLTYILLCEEKFFSKIVDYQ